MKILSGITTVFRVLDRIVRPIERTLVLIAGAGIVTLMVLLLVDMFRRRLLNETFLWLEDLTGLYLIAGAFFLTLAYAHRIDAHIYIDLLSDKLGAGWRRALQFVGELAGIAIFSIVFWTGLHVFLDAAQAGDRGVVTLTWPTWTYYIFVPIGAGLAVIRSLINLVIGRDERPQDDSDLPAPAEAI